MLSHAGLGCSAQYVMSVLACNLLSRAVLRCARLCWDALCNTALSCALLAAGAGHAYISPQALEFILQTQSSNHRYTCDLKTAVQLEKRMQHKFFMAQAAGRMGTSFLGGQAMPGVMPAQHLLLRSYQAHLLGNRKIWHDLLLDCITDL